MFAFDIAMPLALFTITIIARSLSKRVDTTLKNSFEGRKLKARDAALLVVMITVVVSVIVFVPQNAIILLFVSSYSALLFAFSYFFSNIQKRQAQFFAFIIGLMATLGAIFAFLVLRPANLAYQGGLALFALAISAFLILAYEQKRTASHARWYLAVLPPVLFVFLFFIYGPSPFWFPVMMNASGVVIAIVITLYLSSLLTWKVTCMFAALLTMMDIILVLFTGAMITAATHVAELGLPVLISLPTIPIVVSAKGIRYISLGIGDFFFAGTLATQTDKKLGRKTAIVSAATMAFSFGAFEIILLNTDFGAFPGTVMIVCGWLPVVAWKLATRRKTRNIDNKETN